MPSKGVATRSATSLVQGRGSDVAHATAWGLFAAALVIAGVLVGSRGLRDFDVAVVSDAGATAFAAFGVGCRCATWLALLIVACAAQPPAGATARLISLGASRWARDASAAVGGRPSRRMG